LFQKGTKVHAEREGEYREEHKNVSAEYMCITENGKIKKKVRKNMQNDSVNIQHIKSYLLNTPVCLPFSIEFCLL
jgi:hypothetical protein